MIHILNKQDCCGCAACVQRCPKQCIRLVEDAEGFLYPEVNIETCIDCGLCEKVCPLLLKAEPISVQKTLAVKNRDEEERLSSSSGGVFIALAKMILQKDGVVFGAAYDEHWEVMHTYTESLEGVRKMMGSKYMQSRIENAYADAERFLKSGREVLFTGCPCQIAGLHGFLRKDYPNLLAVDFLCHGVPSPGIWRKYLSEMFCVSHGKERGNSKSVLSTTIGNKFVITDISFREKQPYGWKKYSFVVHGQSALKKEQNSVLLSEMYRENSFMCGFLADIYLRPSCYSCKCKNGVSHSDLTIADFWGINKVMEDFDDDKGVGLVLLNTPKALTLFPLLNMECRETSLDVVCHMNGGFKELIPIHPKRDYFYRQIARGKKITEAVESCLRIPLKNRAISYLKRIIKGGLRLLYIRTK